MPHRSAYYVLYNRMTDTRNADCYSNDLEDD